MRRRTKRILVVLLLLAVNALALEAALRFWVRAPRRVVALGSGVDDARWRLSWVHRRTRGATRYAIDAYHPTRGWTLKPGLRDVPLRGASVSSNSRGVRGRRETAVPGPPGTKRVLVFGDSFTFGEEVGDDETYVARLDELFPDAEFLNLGVHGYGHDQMLLYLREAAALYQLDVVVLGYLEIDDVRNLLGFRDFAKPSFALVDGELELRGVPVPRPPEVRAAEPWRLKLLDLGASALRELRWRHGDLRRHARALSDALLLEFAATARRAGATPLIVYLPLPHELGDGAPSRREHEVAALCRAHGVPFLSLRPALAGALHGHQRARPGMRHWDAVEHDVAARAIADHLRASGILRSGAAPVSDGGA